MKQKLSQKKRGLFLLMLASLITFFVTPFIGMKIISLSSIFPSHSGTLDFEVFWNIRLPRVGLAFLSGAGLAVSGMAFQAMFRNALATPFTLGVSSGASLGAALYVRFASLLSLGGFSGLFCFSFLGAFFSVLLVYGLSQFKKSHESGTLLLAGVAVSFFFSSLILFIQYLSDFSSSFRIVRWLMGGLETVGLHSLLSLAPFVLLGSAILFSLTPELNLLTLGNDVAISRGVSLKKTQRLLFFSTSLMIGGVVATCGPIGFVGMIAPHICRLLIGSEHKQLMPATFFFGGAFLAICDALARVLIAPAEIPVGVITALLGGPFFLWLLLRKS